MVGDLFQNPREPDLWIDLVQIGGFDQGECDGHGIAAALRACERPVFVAYMGGGEKMSQLVFARSQARLSISA